MATAIDRSLEERAINSIRFLAVDAVQKANSGHPGLPMGAAAMSYVLWTEYLRHNPKNPKWANRDRFVLSAGHGSALLYSLLYLTGYDLSLDDLKAFRQLGSITPGHPEYGLTPGVEVTTGPLGQGFANGVGMAIAEHFLAATFNRPGHEIIDHYTYGIVSDGDVMEGVSMEAASIAGHLGLGKLIYLYDQNHITLAGTANLSMTEDVAARFEASGWHTISIDGMDTDAVRKAIEDARAVTDRPSLILAHTIIGFGSPKKEGTFGVHGSPLGPDEVLASKKNLDWPEEPTFFVPDAALELFREAVTDGKQAEEEWDAAFASYKKAHPELAATLERALEGELAEGWDADLPKWNVGDKAIATRKASEAVIQAFFPKIPTFIGGSADLNPSTNTGMKGGGDFQPPIPAGSAEIQGELGGDWGYDGRNIHWGIREHAMGSAVNGMAAHGGVVPFSATFLVFSDYMRAPIRLAALSGYHSIFVFTHDSVAVGEDGPTHEPVEQVMSLRLIPALDVIRPADANETRDAWEVALTANGPTVLALSRQDLPILDTAGAHGSLKQGGYILRDTEGTPDIVLLATGSEVALSVEAADLLKEYDVAARVVSLPSWERFEQQTESYRESVLGPWPTPRLSVEAGVTTGWQRYTGPNGGSVGIDTFGASGPGARVLAHYGFTKEHVAASALRLLDKNKDADELDADFDQETVGSGFAGYKGHS
ncbi:MAG TPA: transketolase [Thermomicrobiales bacterium]|nr:transketolase [Thermomicrobiales bacterium]